VVTICPNTWSEIIPLFRNADGDIVDKHLDWGVPLGTRVVNHIAEINKLLLAPDTNKFDECKIDGIGSCQFDLLQVVVGSVEVFGLAPSWRCLVELISNGPAIM
jgi:hypothetical protein